MNILNKNIYFPDLTFILFAFIFVCVAVVGLRFNDTKYTIERFYNMLASENVSREEKLTNIQTDEINKIEAINETGKYEAEIATFIVWGIIGAVLFWICNTIYRLFIKPFYNDSVESHYVNAHKDSLVKKRLLWIVSVFLTFALLAITVYLFTTIVLSFYTIVTYDTTLYTVFLLMLGIIITTLMVTVLRVGLDILAKTY